MPQDTQSYTVDQLASDIKTKFPRYKDIDNQELVTGWVKKYPKYGDHLQAQATKPTTEVKKPTEPQTTGQKLSTGSDALMASISRWRPRWDDPSKVLTDPHWYQTSGRYLAGEALGAGKAVSNVAVGGSKIIHDLASVIDPTENYQRGVFTKEGTATQVGRDVVDLGKGIFDTGKAAWDLVRHFPEAESDPDRFGQNITNMAMTVDGAIKGAHSAATALKIDPVKAATSAYEFTKEYPKALLQKRALEDAYVHTKGVDVAQKFVKSVGEASKHVEEHINALSKIDTNIPSGVIDASKEAGVITKNFSDIVKTPEKYHPVLKSMLDYAQKTAPGQWMFDSTRQLRSAVGRALYAVDGPQYAVLSSVYSDLTTKLRDVAKNYGLESSWDQYNELERKINKSFPIIDKMKGVISGNESGVSAASALKNWKEVQETVKSLSKYGLDSTEVAKYAKYANDILKDRASSYKSIFRHVYSSVPGFATMLATRLTVGGGAGGYAAALGAGYLVGTGVNHLVHAARALKLSPDIVEHVLNSREWPGKKVPATGVFPESDEPKALPEAKTPHTIPPVPTPEVPSVKTAEAKAGIVTPVPKASSEAVGREPGSKPGTTRVSKLGKQTQARERVSAQRTESLRTEQKEIADATKRAQAKEVSVANLQIPEMEEAMKSMNPTAFSGLQKMRKAKSISDVEYTEALKYYILEEYEKRSSGGTPSE